MSLRWMCGKKITSVLGLLFALGLSACTVTANIENLFSNASTVQISISSPSALYMKAANRVSYTVTYEGYQSTQLQVSDITLIGTAVAGCVVDLSGGGDVYTVNVSGCNGDGLVGIQIAAGTAETAHGPAPAVNSDTNVVVDNTLNELSFGQSSFDFSKNAGLVSIPILSSVAKNYDYSEIVVVPAEDNSVTTADYMMSGLVSIPAGSMSGILSLNLNRTSGTIGDQILKLKINNSRLVTNFGNTRTSFVQIRLKDGTDSAVISITDNCAIFANGKLKCAGDNSSGQLGDGTTNQRSGYYEVFPSGVLKNVGTCAILTGGELKCWGYNPYGQVGNGTTVTQNSPVQIMSSNVVAVTASSLHRCALMASGEMNCWGFNAYGSLGSSSTVDSSSPVQIFASGVTQISSAGLSSCAILTGGELKCWGHNFFGQLGNGTTTQQNSPVQIIASGVQQVIQAGYSTCVILAGGELRCWGYNGYGQLGNGTTTQQNSPVQIIAGGVQQVMLSNSSTCAILTGGELKCWGDNSVGQLGDGTTTQRTSPVQIIASDVTSFSSNGISSCAVLTGGELKCWGYNAYGPLGDGTLVQRNSPVQILANSVDQVFHIFH